VRVVILQPSYLPWLGYFDQLHKSDVFVLYDDVQYDKHGWRNRNRIKTPAGAQWLTVPVLTHGQGKPTNREIRIDDRQPWGRKHLQALRVNYAQAPAFAEVVERLEPVLLRSWERLFELNHALLEAVCDLLALRRDIRLSSQLGIPGAQTERLIAICRALGADRYLTGDAAGTGSGPVASLGGRRRCSIRAPARHRTEPSGAAARPQAKRMPAWSCSDWRK